MVFGAFTSGLSGAEGYALGELSAEVRANNVAFVRRALGRRSADVGALQRDINQLAGMVADRDQRIAQLVSQKAARDAEFAQLQRRAEAYERKIEIMTARMLAMFEEGSVAP